MYTEKIDFSKYYKIEAIPSKDVKELRERGISIYPGTTQYVTAAWNDTLKRYDGTGFDENAPHISRIPSEKRDDFKKYIVEKRKELEEKIGLPEGYLKPFSDAWMSDLCIHQIEVGQDLKVRVNGGDNVLRPSVNYKDAILLSLIMNNDKFPKNKASINDPQYKDARFYLTTDEEKATLTRESLTKKKQAYLLFSELFNDKKPNLVKANEVAYKMGLIARDESDIEALEMRMHDTIFDPKNTKLLDEFIATCKLDNKTLTVYNLLSMGIALSVVKVSPDGHYHRGGTNYRKTKHDSVEYLLAPGNEVELAELKSAVEERKKKHKAIG